jgi:LacI family transcriptional regulator
MTVSLKDIAQTLNLSKTSISWILAGKGKERRFSKATIERVKKYAKEVNYQPNLLARSLSMGFTDTIGLIIPAIGDTYYSQLAYAIETEAEKYNFILTICSSEGEGDREDKLIKALKAKRVDGLLIVPSKKSNAGILSLLKEKFPFVLIDRFYPDLKTNYIIVDNEQSSKKLVTHLIEKGSRKIALLTSDIHLLVMNMRIDGYYGALTDSNISNDPCLLKVISRKNYAEDIIRALDELFVEVPDVDGFYFSTHYLALETLRYFITRKIDYKNKFNLACFHDTFALDVLAPNMSISRIPIEEIGKQAVDVLLDNIRKTATDVKGIVLKNKFESYD